MAFCDTAHSAKYWGHIGIATKPYPYILNKIPIQQGGYRNDSCQKYLQKRCSFVLVQNNCGNLLYKRNENIK